MHSNFYENEMIWKLSGKGWTILEKGVKGIKNVGINTNKIILSFTSLREEEYNFAEYPTHKHFPKSWQNTIRFNAWILIN